MFDRWLNVLLLAWEISLRGGVHSILKELASQTFDFEKMKALRPTKLLRTIKLFLLHGRKNPALFLTYLKYESDTMIPCNTYISNLQIALMLSKVDGDVVECGVWNGGMIAGIADTISNQRDRKFYLYDSFEGLPDADLEADGEKAVLWQKLANPENFFENCTGSEEKARCNMLRSKAFKFQITRGWFEKTLLSHPKRSICLLRLDGDWYDSTIQCLQCLARYVHADGCIIVDDYNTWQGCKKAVDQYLVYDKSFKLTITPHFALLKKLPM